MVPLFDIKAQHQAIEPELREAFERVLRSGQFILGPEVEKFERQIAELVGARHAIGVSSGTDAILLALMTLGIGPGDEVLCPSFTFFATAGCIVRVGARPVFVDSCPVCFNLDVNDAARKISKKTKAIIPVHLFGQAADMDGVMGLAQQHGLAVIEDAAQALGAEYRGRKVGAIGTFGAFSFFPTKNLGGLGDGGVLVTNDDAFFGQAQQLRNHGAKQKYYHDLVGGNFRLDALQAAFLAAKLPQLPNYTAKRRENAAFYTDQLSKIPRAVTAADGCCITASEASMGRCSQGVVKSADCQLILPVSAPHNCHIWNQYTIRVIGSGKRDALRRSLAQAGIGSDIYYPIPSHRQRCFGAFGPVDRLPIAEMLAEQCLSIPIFPELAREQLDAVVDGISRFSSMLKPAAA